MKIGYLNTDMDNAKAVLKNSVRQLPTDEKNAVANDFADLRYGSLVLKTALQGGALEELITPQRNADPKKAINDFRDGQISADGATGSLGVTHLRVTAAIGNGTAVLPEEQTYKSTNFPTDLENAELWVRVSGKVVYKAKLAEFALKGDEPQDNAAITKPVGSPFALPLNAKIGLEIHRPQGVTTVTTNLFASIEFIGYHYAQ